MANGDLVLQPSSEQSGLVFGARLYTTPLLPFEKQLIELIGCSEEEYRRFTAEAERRSKIRPAEYDHIPDIRCDPVITPILISLAVGLVTSAVSYLLAPKPQQPQSGATSRELDSIRGGDRFLSTFGFDSQAELANYGDPIPIVFGRYTGTSGGILAAPRLVWSRMFSYGTQQAIKLLFVVGEQGYSAGQTPQGLDTPDLTGIFLGNTPLDVVYKSQFAFYWRRNTTLSGTGRIVGVHLRYGSRGIPASGDPENFNDVFSCPTAQAENDFGFSSAHQLSSNSEFGCYASIPNGTGYRVNWRVISVPKVSKDTYDNDPKATLAYERIKIAGLGNKDYKDFSEDRAFRAAVNEYAMRGLGRNWSRRMGLISADSIKASPSEGFKLVPVSVTSSAVFKISGKQIPKEYFGPNVNVDDINSALNEQRIEADDMLQLGELFMIGRTVWKVTSRQIAQWRPENNQEQVVTLECIEVIGPNRIGIVAEEALELDYLWDEVPNQLGMGVAFFPLQKVSLAAIRNTRSCEVTELGIRSSVYQRLNGLCNFQSVPSPAGLQESDKDKISISSGTTSTFTRRASAFTLYVRPSTNPTGSSESSRWEPIGENFVVVGNKPVDAYNFLRIKHPSRNQWEFRIVPKNAADLAFNDTDATRYWSLNAAASTGSTSTSILSSTYSTAYGNFTITGVGTLVNRTAIRSNAELASKPNLQQQVTQATTPEQVSIYSLYPPDANENVTVTATRVDGFVTVPNAGYNIGMGAAFGWERFNPFPPDVVEGGSTYRVIRHYVTSDRWVDIGYTIRKDRLPDGHYSNRLYRWQITNHVIVASSNNWAGVASFNTLTPITAENPFKFPPGFPPFDAVGEAHTVTGTNGRTIGRLQGFLEQVLGPARDYGLNFQLSANVTYEEGSKKIQLKITARVEPLFNHWTGLTKWWSTPTIEVVKDPAVTTSNWNTNDRFTIYRGLSATNPFGPANTNVGVEFGISSVTINQTVVTETLTGERIFESQSQYGDISHYGSLIEKSNNNSAEHRVVYVNEIVSNSEPPSYDRMTVCGLSLKASRNFNTVDQLRVWLATGIPVVRFHPDDGGNLPLTALERIGPSNLFCDLVYYLLTDTVAGLGDVLGISAEDPQIINTDDLVRTARFLKANRLFFDGALTSPSNFRQFVADTAPLFLCNFVISDGKFSLLPAVPTNNDGTISSNPVQIKQLFTSGNIVEDTFQLDYIAAEERKPFQAVLRYREERRNQLPQERNISIRFADSDQYAPVESFDLTQFCTTADHAELVGRYLLSVRKRITHSVQFKTLPFGIGLAPGDYIKVMTEASPYSAAKNGRIDSSGNITSVTPITDGQYSILYYKLGSTDVLPATMSVSGGKVAQSALFDTIFTLVESTISENVYMVEQITLDEDGLASITASEFPCNESRASLLAQDLLPQSRGFFVIER